MQAPMPGTLYIVATPIGNLEDLTFRALRTLKEVDLIAAEDTRRTRGLLTHYGISKPLVSLREHNERRESPRLVDRLIAGESVALVSDAGTPGISDPGAGFVRLAREAGIRVVPIPGPSAITAALSVSGLELDSFVFLGFPPSSGAARREWFEALVREPRTVVFLEAPHRIKKSLADIKSVSSIRPIVVCRELTKRFEQLVICNINDIEIDSVEPTGEFVVILAGEPADEVIASSESSDALGLRLIGHLSKFDNLSEEAVLAAAASGSGVQARRLRRLVKKARFARNREREQSEQEQS